MTLWEKVEVIAFITFCVCICVCFICAGWERCYTHKLKIMTAELEKIRIEHSGKVDGVIYCPHCGQKYTIKQEKEQGGNYD